MSQEFFYISVCKGASPTYGMTLLGSGPCVVSDVTSDGPASRALVRPGFVVLEIDGRNVIHKNHKEVREIIRSAETKDWITFKFSTLDSACQFFGDDLRTMYEACSKKRRSSGGSVKKPSPRKSDPSKAPTAKENINGGLYQSVAVQVDPLAVGSVSSHQQLKCDDPKKPATPPRISKPVPLPRFGPEVSRRSHVQQNKDLTRWMRSTEQQALNSPVLTAAAPSLASPHTPTVPSVEFVCLYYSNLVDLLGSLQESVFRKNVQYLRNYEVPPQFWARLVFTEKRLTIYRPEGKYATYSPKHMRDVFVHEDGNFFGFSTIRMSKVQGTSPTNTLESSQTMDVFSCHILCVDQAIQNSKSEQRDVLAQLLGKDRLVTNDSPAASTYFPEDAYKVSEFLENLAGKPELVKEVRDVAKLISSNVIPLAKPGLPEEDTYFEANGDGTDTFNSASVLRNSMRKYGPYSNLQQRHSISIDSLNTLPNRSAFPSATSQNRYSCIVGTNGSAPDRCHSTKIPATIGENEVLKTKSHYSTDTYDSLSSYEQDSGWTRDVSSSLDLTAHTSTGVSFGDEGCFQEALCLPERAELPKLDLFQVLNNAKGLNLFQTFLTQEHSQENINFWLACQDYRTVKKTKEMKNMAKKMFERFLSANAPESINVDSDVRNSIQKNLHIPNTASFDVAAKQIFDLMNNDSFPRFLRSPFYLQFRQLLDPNPYSINQSLPCLNNVEPFSAPSRQSGLFSWLVKKKPDHDQLDVSRQSLPAFNNTSSNVSLQSESSPSPKNPIRKLIDKGRKSFSARVKPTKRESLMTFLSDSEIRGGSVEPQSAVPTVPFEFRKPLTPPITSDVVMRRPTKPRSAGKEQNKRLSLQGLQRSAKTKGVTEPTEWTFSRSSLDDCLETPPVPPKQHEILIAHRHLKPVARPSSQLRMADF